MTAWRWATVVLLVGAVLGGCLPRHGGAGPSSEATFVVS